MLQLMESPGVYHLWSTDKETAYDYPEVVVEMNRDNLGLTATCLDWLERWTMTFTPCSDCMNISICGVWDGDMTKLQKNTLLFIVDKMEIKTDEIKAPTSFIEFLSCNPLPSPQNTKE